MAKHPHVKVYLSGKQAAALSKSARTLLERRCRALVVRENPKTIGHWFSDRRLRVGGRVYRCSALVNVVDATMSAPSAHVTFTLIEPQTTPTK